MSASDPVSYAPVSFTGLSTDARNNTSLNVAAAYVQDQVKQTPWLEAIGGVRVERFDLGYVDLNVQGTTYGRTFGRVDDLMSPRLGVVVKPVEPVSLYASYSVSYQPASGDQFNSLTAGASLGRPRKTREQGNRREVGHHAAARLRFADLPARPHQFAVSRSCQSRLLPSESLPISPLSPR